MPPEVDSTSESLTVVFPRRLAGIGLGLFSSGLAVAVILLAVQHRQDSSVSWLGLIFGAGAILGLSYSFRQFMNPRVQLVADRDRVVVYRRTFRDGQFPDGQLIVPWRQVLDMDYVEKVAGIGRNASQYKIVRLRLDHEAPVGSRYFDDDDDPLNDDTVHIDAFAAEPGGEELLRRLEVLRPAGSQD